MTFRVDEHTMAQPLNRYLNHANRNHFTTEWIHADGKEWKRDIAWRQVSDSGWAGLGDAEGQIQRAGGGAYPIQTKTSRAGNFRMDKPSEAARK